MTDTVDHQPLAVNAKLSEPLNALGKPPGGAGKTPSQTRTDTASWRAHAHERSEVGFTQMLGALLIAIIMQFIGGRFYCLITTGKYT